MADKTIKYLLVGQDKSASKTLKDVGEAAEKTGGKLGKMGEIAGGVLGANLLQSAASAAVDFGKQSVEAFTGAEQAQRKLDDAYKRFPATADVSIAKMRELNSAIQSKTGADADDLAAAQATLAQYKLSGKQIAELTPLLDDYAVKTGKDLPTAAQDLGKAMLGQGRSLKEVGINFKDAKSVAGNFDQVMGGLRKQVGGFAEQEGNAAEGTLRKLQTEFGDVQEAVGSALLPVLVELGKGLLGVIDHAQAFSEQVMPTIDNLTKGLGGVWDIVANGNFSSALTDAFGWEEDSAAVDFLFNVRDGFLGVQEIFDTLLSGDYTGKLEELFGWGEDSAPVDFLFDVREGFMSIWDAVQGMWAVVEPILLEVWDTIVTKWGELQPEVDDIFGSIQGIVENVMSVIESVVKLATEALTWIWDTWGDEILSTLGILFDTLVGFFSGFFTTIEGVWTFLASMLKGDTEGMADGIEMIFDGLFKTLGSLFSGAVRILGQVWSGIKDVFAGPVNWVISNVINPFIDAINGLAKAFGITLGLARVALMATSGGSGGGAAGAGGGMQQFAGGGYTGPGGKYQPAGIVHAGEVVWSQEDVAAWGGPQSVDKMRKARADAARYGYAGGGIVGNFSGYDPAALSAMQAWAAATGRTWTQTGAGGSRTHEKQWQLYLNYLNGGNLAADPRKGLGPHMVPAIAMDLSPRPGENPAAKALLGRYGLGLTVPGEPWHIAYLAGRGGGVTAGGGGFDFAAMVDGILAPLTGKMKESLGGGAMADILMGLPPMMADWAVEKLSSVVTAVTGAVGGGGGSAAPGSAKSLAQGMAAQYGWTGAQWAALDALIQKESSWNPNAQNPTSTAYGLFQFLNSTWSGVGAVKTSDPGGQINAGLKYISQRYGTPSAAWAFHQRNNWYKNGTNHAAPGWAVVGEDGPELINLRGGEQVIPNGGNRSRTIPTVGQQQRMHPDDLRELGAMLDRRPVVVQMDGRVVAESTRRHNRAVR